MPSPGYVSPFRRAFQSLLRFDAAFTIEEVLKLAGSDSTRAAKAQATRLVRRYVLVRLDGDRYARGAPEPVKAYMNEKPNSQPGGNSKRYKAASAVRDQKAQEEWRGESGGSETLPEDNGPIPLATDDPDKGMKPGRVAELCDVHRTTVERWIRQGKLPGFVLPNGALRAKVSAVEAMING